MMRLNDIWAEKQIEKIAGPGSGPDYATTEGRYSHLFKHKQEQPEFPTTDEEVEKALASIPKVELPDKYKTPDWLFKQQEQPEVDLEKEIQSFWNANALEYRLGHVADINFLAYTARHFYELGLNARKED